MERVKELGYSTFDRFTQKVKHVFVRRAYKDELFRCIFNDKRALLDLYNAVNHTKYMDINQLEVYTIENTIYLGYRNDLSFIVCGSLNLYEHQSTINPNMPLRGLLYFAIQYRAYIEQRELNLYGDYQIKIPSPQYIVFYNGQEEWMEGKDVFELSLQDAFYQPEGREVRPCLECRATVYNINYGHNRELMKQCRKLQEYSIFVNKVVQYKQQKMSNEDAVERAVEECIEEGVLRNYLVKHRAEVVGMFLETLNRRKIEKMMIRDARKAAMEAGIAEGITQGIAQGREQGRELGIAQGIEQGIAQGREQGRELGIAQGIEQGIAQGRELGIAQGREQGMEQGIASERLSAITRMLAAGFTHQQIISCGYTEEEIEQVTK